MQTITTLIAEAQQSLKNFASARLDAELLLCKVMQCKRTTIYAYPEKNIPAKQATQFKSLVHQRQRGRPIAHLTHEKEFWLLKLSINAATFIPRPETECLIHHALKMIPTDTEFTILDLGVGSGSIALALAHERPNCHVTALDISDQALKTAQQNAAKHQINNIDFLLSDWYQALPPTQFDMIVSNPPYIQQHDIHLLSNDIRFEPRIALVAGTDGMQSIDHILTRALEYLSDNGYILIEHGYKQKQLVQNAFYRNGFQAVTTCKDLAGHDRITYGR